MLLRCMFTMTILSMAHQVIAEEEGAQEKLHILTMSGQVGVASYEEHPTIAPVDSEWSAVEVSALGRYTYYSPGGYLAALTARVWQSAEDLEKWTENGLPVQKNDLIVSGVDLRAEAGLTLNPSESISLTPRLGIGYRNFLFERSDFVRNGEPSALGTVEEIYDIIYLFARSELQHNWTPSSGLSLSLLGGAVVFSEADNDLVSRSIEGHGGVIVQGDVSWFWDVHEKRRLALGIHVDVERLEGEATTIIENGGAGDVRFLDVEWPDNDWASVSLGFTWQETF